MSLFSLQNFEVEADDLVTISELGRGAYGVVEKVRHAQSGTIMAVKVRMASSWWGRGAVGQNGDRNGGLVDLVPSCVQPKVALRWCHPLWCCL